MGQEKFVGQRLTFCHCATQRSALLYYFCVSVDFVSHVFNVSTLDVGNNFSDYLSVVLSLFLANNLSACNYSKENNINKASYQLHWDKANLQQYDRYTYSFLDGIGLGYAQTFLNCKIGCTCGRW